MVGGWWLVVVGDGGGWWWVGVGGGGWGWVVGHQPTTVLTAFLSEARCRMARPSVWFTARIASNTVRVWGLGRSGLTSTVALGGSPVVLCQVLKPLKNLNLRPEEP